MLVLHLFTIITVLFLYIFYIKCIRPHSYWKRKAVLQGPSVWAFGEFWRMLREGESYGETIMRIYRKFPSSRYFGTYLFSTPILVVRDTELIKKITIKNFKHFADRNLLVPDTLEPLLKNNMYSLNGHRWKEQRKLMSPAFSSGSMKDMFKLIKDATNVFVNYYQDIQEDVLELNLKDSLNRYTFDVTATTAFGIEVNSLKVRNNEFYELGAELTDFSTGLKSLLFFRSFLKLDNILKACNFKLFSEKFLNYFTGIVEDLVKIREDSGVVRPDVIQLLLGIRKGPYSSKEEKVTGTEFATAETPSFSNKITSKVDLSNTDIAIQASLFFFGGFEEISTTCRFLVYELAVRPDIQSKLRDEINETFKECQGNLTYESLKKMIYMDMVVSEVLRKWPSNGNLERVCSKRYTIPALHPGEKDLTIEEGTVIWMPALGIHYDPLYFPDPDQFDPDRFSKLNSDFNPDAFIPFGMGPRGCVGCKLAVLEIKVLFFEFLRKFEVIPVEKSNIPTKISRNNFSLEDNRFWFRIKKLNVS